MFKSTVALTSDDEYADETEPVLVHLVGTYRAELRNLEVAPERILSQDAVGMIRGDADEVVIRFGISKYKLGAANVTPLHCQETRKGAASLVSVCQELWSQKYCKV